MRLGCDQAVGDICRGTHYCRSQPGNGITKELIILLVLKGSILECWSVWPITQLISCCGSIISLERRPEAPGPPPGPVQVLGSDHLKGESAKGRKERETRKEKDTDRIIVYKRRNRNRSKRKDRKGIHKKTWEEDTYERGGVRQGARRNEVDNKAWRRRKKKKMMMKKEKEKKQEEKDKSEDKRNCNTKSSLNTSSKGSHWWFWHFHLNASNSLGLSPVALALALAELLVRHRLLRLPHRQLWVLVMIGKRVRTWSVGLYTMDGTMEPYIDKIRQDRIR